MHQNRYPITIPLYSSSAIKHVHVSKTDRDDHVPDRIKSTISRFRNNVVQVKQFSEL